MSPSAERSPQANGHAAGHAPRVLAAHDIAPEQLDQDALRVISRLERNGYQAYLVGGCVRDLLVGRRPKDFDVATSAHPRQIKRLFRNGRIIGRRFRLVHIQYGEHIVETATFRRDPQSDPSDAQDGEEAASQDLLITEDNEYGSAEEDARRRDFTVNALFLDPTRMQILDYVGGLEDLESRLLRTIGDPFVRMAEDPVRILRAVKFATRLGLRIEERTWEAMCELAPALERSAPPRVLEEILRLLRSGTALGALRMLRECGALRVILPAVDEHVRWVEERRREGRELLSDLDPWRLLEALDAEVHAGYVPTTPVAIALLFLGIIERGVHPEEPSLEGEARELQIVAGEVLEPLTVSARLSRRDCGRARRIVVQQRRFEQPPTRRFRPLLFMRSEDFPEALELFRIRAGARGQGWDIVEGWRERHELALRTPSEDLDAERRQGRKRRRRRRRRSSGADGAASARPS